MDKLVLLKLVYYVPEIVLFYVDILFIVVEIIVASNKAVGLILKDQFESIVHLIFAQLYARAIQTLKMAVSYIKRVRSIFNLSSLRIFILCRYEILCD